jgi:hypothetical protein
LYLDQDQFATNTFLANEIVDLDDVDQLVQLIDALVESFFVPVQSHGNAGTTLHVRGADVKGIYVKASTAEKTGDPCQNTKLVFDDD